MQHEQLMRTEENGNPRLFNFWQMLETKFFGEIAVTPAAWMTDGTAPK